MAVPPQKQKLGVSVPLLQTIVWCVQKHDCRTKALPKTQERHCATANKNTTVTNEILSPCRIPGQKGMRIFAHFVFWISLAAILQNHPEKYLLMGDTHPLSLTGIQISQ